MKKLIENVKNILSKPKNIILFYWSILVIIILAIFFCFIYSDILFTTKNSINLLQTISKGRPLDFYAVNYNLIIDKFLPMATWACYELPIYIIFAIWNIPIWIAQNIFHIQITESLLCLIWIKAILIFFLGLCMVVIKRICVEIKINKININWVLFTFVSSPLLLMSLFVMSQYDIIAILFILLGILMYLKNNIKWFIFWFAIAIVIKMFALFIFIPFVLLKYKKIIKIIKYVAAGLIPLILTKVISLQMPMYKESTSAFSDGMLLRLFSKGIDINYGSASLFCAALIAIAIFCYIKNIKNKEELDKYSIYLPLLVFSCFFIFVDFHPYWIILITPFVAITLFQNMKYFKINIILDIISSFAIIVSSIFIYYWCYGPLLIERMVLPKLIGSTYGTTRNYPYLSDLFTKFGIQKYLPFFLAAYITCTIAFLIINFPKDSVNIKDENNIEWGLLLFRLAIILPIPILMIYCYYV